MQRLAKNAEIGKECWLFEEIGKHCNAEMFAEIGKEPQSSSPVPVGYHRYL